MYWGLAACALSACGNTSGDTSRVCAALTVTEPHSPAGWGGSVFTVVMENKSRGDILGNPDAPYINSLVHTGAFAAGYHDPFVHPSEPNYLWMVAGENFGVLDDDDPDEHPLDSTSHIADQLELAGLSWKSYQQSMGGACGVTSHGAYAAKHDPFVYFTDITGDAPRCAEHVVDYSQLDADLASGQVPKYVFITPDLDHDMHDGSIAVGDGWLKAELPKIFASDAFQHGGVLFLLWDEGSGLLDPEDDPPFIAISPNARSGLVSNTGYDTSSYLKTVQRILGLDELPCSATPDEVPVMTELFSAPM
jgi:phospholipase C